MEKQDNNVALNSLHYFNAHTRNAEDVVNTFIARRAVLKELEDGILDEADNSIPQHYMIIGSRGMGKSTLLRRLEISLRSARFIERFVPILFPEEQYNIDRLSKFWLNSLDALADSLEIEQKHDQTAQLDRAISEIAKIDGEPARAEQSYQSLLDICKEMNRRPVFLIDNIDILFAGISATEQFKLRELITTNGAPIFVSASTSNPAESQDYDAAFYDAFDNIYLERLSQHEMRELLLYLAEKTGESQTFEDIYEKTGQLDALHSLTGGNPRIAVFLFQLIANGLSEKIFENLNALLDIITPLYKSNFEQLSKQAQIIVDALALNWDPCDLDTLSTITRLENNQLSAQIERLIKQGWVERGNRFSIEKNKLLNKIKNYSIRERFFNIWYIMRRASRRQRGDLKSLTCFLETFYTPVHLEQEKKRVIQLIKENLDGDKITYGLALSKAFQTNEKESEMEEEIYKEVLARTKGDLKKIAHYIDPDSIPNRIMANFMGGTTTLWIDYIMELEEKGDFSKLEEFLLLLLENEKLSSDNYVLTKLGHSYMELGELNKAEDALEKAMQSEPENSWTYIYLADLYEKKVSLDKALNAYQQAAIFSDDPYYHYRLGRFYFEQGNKTKAEQIWLDAFERNPDYYYLASMLGLHYMMEQNYAKAIPFFEKVSILDPTEASSFEFLARCQWSVKDKNAKNNFEKALALEPESSSYWFRYANYLKSEHEFEDAEMAFLKAIEYGKDNDAYFVEYGRFLFVDRAKYKQAQKYLLAALAINPKKETKIRLAAAYMMTKDYDQALELYNQILKSDKKYAYAYTGIAIYQDYTLKDYRSAVKNYSKSLKLNPKQGGVWSQYANLLHYRLKDYKKAAEAYKQSLGKNDSEFNPFVDYITLLRDQLHRREEAEVLFEQQTDLVESDPVAFWLQKALFSLYRKNYGNAIEEWKSALDYFDESTEQDELEILWRSVATSYHLGFGEELLNVFEDIESDKALRPLYEALKTMILGSVDYLSNIAPEISETAIKIYDDMRNYLASPEE